MSKILFAWELGANFGHLVRDLPVAERLRAAGHQVVFAVRDSRIAAEILVPRKFNFVQAPVCQGSKFLKSPPINYAGLLAAEGWRDRIALLGHVRAWLSTLALLQCGVVVADHAPGALLAARLSGRLGIAFGSGFEIPPNEEPMPTIRPWEEIDTPRLQAEEQMLVKGINSVLQNLGGLPLASLGDMFGEHKLLTTVPELDHYKNRVGGHYVGSIHGIPGRPSAQWPTAGKKRVLAYMRTNQPGTIATLTAIKTLKVNAVCLIPGVSRALKAEYESEYISIFDKPVDLESVLEHVDVVVNYGSCGVVTASLQQGIPTVMMPTTVEQYLLTRRVTELGAGVHLERASEVASVVEALSRVLLEPSFREKAGLFRERNQPVATDHAPLTATKEILGLIGLREMAQATKQ